MGNSASKSDGEEPSAPANKLDSMKSSCGCAQAQDPANPKPSCKAIFSCPEDGECRSKQECCAPACCSAAEKPHNPASKATPPSTPPPSSVVGRELAARPAPQVPHQAAHQQPVHHQPTHHQTEHHQLPVPGHQGGYQQAYYVPQSGSHESPAFYITSKDPQSHQPPPHLTQQIHHPSPKTQEMAAQLPNQVSPPPPQHRTITLPPPMMLSGATPVRGPPPIAPQHQHLYTNSTSPPIAQVQAPPKRQAGCSSMQNVCSPSLCPPFKAKPDAVTGTDGQAVPHGPGPGPHTMATSPRGYTNHQENRPDTIPPNIPPTESPPTTGKIYSKQVYPPILQNYQSVQPVAGANPANGNGQPHMSAPAAAHVSHAIPPATVPRPGFGDAL